MELHPVYTITHLEEDSIESIPWAILEDLPEETQEIIRGARVVSTYEEEKVEQDKATFYAEVDKVQTMADGSIRVVLGLGEDGLAVMQFLARCKQQGIVLDIVATAREE